ncbi:cobalamin-binding protein [Mucilaginibacter sp. HMF5004]|uniref:cobalamin-binding protein n=1 Tax=Mucilaginibacter rivuli TaxID=2857527 RepID=UPI001C5DDCC4|nr:cobalamin-binding protein [Mucilaginibacter rivuli]MBW4888878.1 cobalamin-binding protein [Mucilaginibacter rivuli]
MNKVSDKRIVSLLAATTEIVCALGLEKNLVGVSHECDYPESVKKLPQCSDVRFIPGASSLEIDKKVKEILTDALSIYTINKELIKELQPDMVLTQAQCEVCAVSLKDVEEALENLLDKEAEIISVQPNTLGDIFKDITLIAQKLDTIDAGMQLIESLEERMDIIRHKLKFIADKPTVACIEWMEPLMVAGNWVPEMVEIAGGKSVLAVNGKHSPFISWEVLKAEDPDIIIITPCGFDIERTLKEIDVILALPGFGELKAVKNNRLYIADGNQYFNRSGPRIVDSVEILAEIIYPKQFIFGYEGNGWMKFSV